MKQKLPPAALDNFGRDGVLPVRSGSSDHTFKSQFMAGTSEKMRFLGSAGVRKRLENIVPGHNE